MTRARKKLEAEPVHDLRVGIRRFSQALTVFPGFIPAAGLKPIRRELKKMMHLTSEIRDRDIAAGFLADSKHAKLKQQVLEDRSEYAGQFKELVQRWTSEGLLDQWRAAPAATHALPSTAASKFFHAGRKAVRGKQSPSELHAFRVETKRFRYALELLAPVYGASLAPRLQSLKDVQSHLGKISDLYTTRQLLKHHPKLREKLDRQGQKEMRAFRDHWKKTFDAPGELKAWKQFLAGV